MDSQSPDAKMSVNKASDNKSSNIKSLNNQALNHNALNHNALNHNALNHKALSNDVKPTTSESVKTITPRHPDSRLQSDWLFLYEKLPPSLWYSSDYAYKTSGWLNVHTNIRKRQRILRQLSEEYLMGALNWENYRSQILERINIHVLKLHQHHSVEDHGFFPNFVSSYPQLQKGFEILERDHVKLNAILDDLQGLNDELVKAELEDKALAEKVHKNLITGTDFLSQHLTDEEDLVVPILALRDG